MRVTFSRAVKVKTRLQGFYCELKSVVGRKISRGTRSSGYKPEKVPQGPISYHFSLVMDPYCVKLYAVWSPFFFPQTHKVSVFLLN